MLNNYLIIAIGGAAGAVTRYLIGTFALNRLGFHFPYGTLFANLIGCFIIGVFMTFFTERIVMNPAWKLLITIGFLGSLTTFSSFSYESIKLLLSGQYLFGFLNISANMILGFGATLLGIIIARLV